MSGAAAMRTNKSIPSYREPYWSYAFPGRDSLVAWVLIHVLRTAGARVWDNEDLGQDPRYVFNQERKRFFFEKKKQKTFASGILA
jgi:hypothetical protein